MNKRETILAALDADVPQMLEQLAEQTGFERATLSSTLTQLKDAGKCRRGREGWVRTGVVGEVPGPKAEATAAPKKRVSNPPRRAKPAKRVSKKRRKSASAAGGGRAEDGGDNPVAIGRFGEFIVLRKSDFEQLLAVLGRWRTALGA